MNSSSSLNVAAVGGLDTTTIVNTATSTIEQQHTKSAMLQQTPPHHHPSSLQILQQQTLLPPPTFPPHLFIQGGNNNNNNEYNNNKNGMSEGNVDGIGSGGGGNGLPYNNKLVDTSGQQQQQNFNNTSFVEPTTKNVIAGMMYQQYAGIVEKQIKTSNNPIVEEDPNAAACSSEDGDFRSGGRIRKRRYSMARIQPTRIKKVMQSDEDIGRMVASVPVAIGSAMELFAEKLLQSAAGALQHSSTKTLSPVHIKQAVLCTPHFAFLEPLLREVPLGTNIPAAAIGRSVIATTISTMTPQQQQMIMMQQQQYYQQESSTSTNITSNN